MNQAMITTEFGGLIRQELDIEALLRTTLEYVLARCGPTNAAVFLPTTSGDFSLGAYVNYDCPRDSADMLLDHLANAVAPKLEHLTEPRHLIDRDSVRELVGDDAIWLGESQVIAMACRVQPAEGESDDHEPEKPATAKAECLAIVLLFRDVHSPYLHPFVSELSTIGGLFACQLARVIRIHHRHIPRDKWGAPGDASTDEADESF